MNSTSPRHPLALLVSSLTATAAVVIAMALSNAVAGPRKGAEQLSGAGAPVVVRSVAASKAVHGGCGSCVTGTSLRAVSGAKGGQVLALRGTPKSAVSTHGCGGGCSTTLASAGHGKGKVETAQHACSASTDACR